MDGAIAPNGDMHIYGLGNRWAINPYKYVGGEIETDIFPDVPYFVSENYTMKKVRWCRVFRKLRFRKTDAWTFSYMKQRRALLKVIGRPSSSILI